MAYCEEHGCPDSVCGGHQHLDWKTLAEEAACQHGKTLRERDMREHTLKERIDELDEQRVDWLVELAAAAGVRTEFHDPQKEFEAIICKITRTQQLYRDALAQLAAQRVSSGR